MPELRLKNGISIPILLERECDPGIRKIAGKLIRDIERTSGAVGRMTDHIDDADYAIVIAQADESELAGELQKRIPTLRELDGKWEAFGFYLLENPIPGVKNGLVIYGSDKLGTIYGMFHLSELLGVTAMEFWGDAVPAFHESITLTTEDSLEEDGCAIMVENGNPKEPSVKYRGFFINDEWPCFGEWTFSHYQGFTAEMYDHVFEFLLRLKGNYIWPAMWTSSFLLDGPDMASMELADMYGIYVGMSHHEPCMRSSEEWDLFKGEDGPYNTAWDYRTNKEGLLRYWADALDRAKGHQVFPTLGMRGERDSKLLEEQATIDDNVRLLKDVIKEQRKLIREHMDSDLKNIPQLFAVYKEVEDYYFGDGTGEKIRGYEELDDVTLLLCEDNYGNMRALPDEEMRKHPGGFGMYYHLDYHGSPVSYEWVNSTPLSKIWEQMTQAYEYGIRTLWIVNVGDLKFQEYPLNYFMELAYDYDTWGSKNMNSPSEYAAAWTQRQFGGHVKEDLCEQIKEVLTETARLNGLRRPEAMNDKVYHPVHFLEGERMLKRCNALEECNETIRKSLAGTAAESGYLSMIWYPAAASANLIKMHLYAAYNHLYAEQGKAIANSYGEWSDQCILRDEELGDAFAALFDGKWSGMQKAPHIGFRNWNMEDWRYPVRHVLRLPKQKRLIVSRGDSEQSFTNQYFPVLLLVDDFCFAGAKKVTLQIADGGEEPLAWQIEGNSELLVFSKTEGITTGQDEVEICVRKEKLKQETAQVDIVVRSGEEFVPVRVLIRKPDLEDIPHNTFLPKKGCYVIPAEGYAKSTSVTKNASCSSFRMISDYGKHGNGMKVFPVTERFGLEEEAPSLTYRFFAEQEQSVVLEVRTSPANPLQSGGSLSFGVSVNEEDRKRMDVTGEGYHGGDHECDAWADAVLCQEHIVCMDIRIRKGVNTVTIYGQEPGMVLEQLRIYPGTAPLPDSYLGPKDSFCVR